MDDIFADLLNNNSKKQNNAFGSQTLNQLQTNGNVPQPPKQQSAFNLDLDFLDEYVSNSNSNSNSKSTINANSSHANNNTNTESFNLLDNHADIQFNLLNDNNSHQPNPTIASSINTPKPKSKSEPQSYTQPPSVDTLRDELLAELIDMGFNTDNANKALDKTAQTSGSKYDINRAINFLMADHQQNPQNPYANNTITNNKVGDIGSLMDDLSNDFFTRASLFGKQLQKELKRNITGPGSRSFNSQAQPQWMKNNERYKNHENTIHQNEYVNANDNDNDNDNDTNNDTNNDVQVLNSRPQQSLQPNSTPMPTRNSTSNQALVGSLLDDNWTSISKTSSSPTTNNTRMGSHSTLPQQHKHTQRSTPQQKNPTFSLNIPTLTPQQQSQLSTLRSQAAETIQRGDYTQSIKYYDEISKLLTNDHPLMIIIYSNLALVYSKLGDPKHQLNSSIMGLNLIQSLTNNTDIFEWANVEIEDGKSLKSLWIKILTKKAQALDLLERWEEAKPIYEQLIKLGETNKSIMDGKSRCIRALTPKPKPTPKPQSQSQSQSQTTSNLTITPSVKAKEAINKVRKDNIANAQLESKKFQLHDQINQRLNQWRRGNELNIRALLCSLDQILWPELEWKSIKLTDLVLDKKVKIYYMRAIGRVHPDKITNDSNVEHQMIAEGVFVTLNQAWEHFKN